MKVTLWNDDLELVAPLDLRKYYYKLSIQDATCNDYLQRDYIQTSKASVFKVLSLCLMVMVIFLAYYFIFFFV
jgi:hypothetical protein